MKKAFYYLRHEDYRTNANGNVMKPYGCVCVLKDDSGKISRGISLCSYDDSFSKQTARNKAEGYARRAFTKDAPILKRYSGFLMGVLDTVFKDENQTNAFLEKYSYKYPQSMILVDENGNVPEYAEIAHLTDFEKEILEN